MSSPNPIASDMDLEYRESSEREKYEAQRSPLRAAGYSLSDVGLRDDINRNEVPSNNRLNGNDFLPDILDAQQRLISAQHQFLHDNDMMALARAQLNVIAVQNDVMHRMGVFG